MTPTVFRKCVDAAPGGNDGTVEEFLTPTCSPKPKLANKEENGKNDAVTDEGTPHYEMGKTLAQMVIPTEPKSRDSTKEHLDPTRNRHGLSNHSVCHDHKSSYPRMDPSFQVKAKIDT